MYHHKHSIAFPISMAAAAAAAAAADSGSQSDDPQMVVISSSTLQSLLPNSVLIPHLHSSIPTLSPSIHSPARHSHRLSPTSSLLLLMPCWSHHPSLPYLGVKIVTVNPSVKASYTLFSTLSGSPLASIDGTLLTLLRTSAVSALASQFLSRPHSSTLLLLGAGALAPHLVSAHRHVRPSLTRIILWNRTVPKAQLLLDRLERRQHGDNRVAFETATDLDSAVAAADIVCCATGSEVPLVRGEALRSGTHLNMMGSFRPEMRECDDEAVRRGRVFVDSEEALVEAGELVGAIERGVIGRNDVVGTLVDLAGGRVVGRRSEEEVTVFKSVGTGVFDILAAQLAYESYFRRGSQ